MSPKDAVETARDWLPIGTVGAPQGLRGGFFCILDDGRAEALSCMRIALGPPLAPPHAERPPSADELRVYDVVRSFVSGGRCVLTLRDVPTREGAASLRGRRIFVSRHEIELSEGEILVADLVGTEVLDEHGAVLGAVKGVHDFGAQPTLEISSSEGRSFYFPFIEPFVVNHDMTRRVMTIRQAHEFSSGDA